MDNYKTITLLIRKFRMGGSIPRLSSDMLALSAVEFDIVIDLHCAAKVILILIY